MKLRLKFVATILLLLTHPSLRAETTSSAASMERIEVAPDHWTFRTAASHESFVPFGVNYTPSWSGWAPNYFSEEKFDAAQIAADFDKMQQLGVNVCKVVLTGKRILPDPQTTSSAVLDTGCLQRFDTLLDIAGKRGIRLIATFEIGWHGVPLWFNREGRWFGQGPRNVLADFWKQFATRFKGDGRIFAYSFCVETALRDWNTSSSLPAWREWAQSQYGTLEKANAQWGTTFTEWRKLPAAGVDGCNTPDWRKQPEGTDANENKTNDPFLYDYMQFREHAAFRHMHNQARAIKAVDPQALCTMGFIQWGMLHRSYGKTHEGLLFGIEYNPRELARTLDFVGIHFYPTFTADWGDDTQLKCAELWARWAFAGKPVVIEEFNMYPAERNVVWCEKLIRHSKRYVSGWLAWSFNNVPGSDDITKVSGLYDEAGGLTAWGEKFRAMAPEVHNWKLVRDTPVRTVPANKRFLVTSGRYREFLDSLLQADTQAVDFEMEHNPAISRMIE